MHFEIIGAVIFVAVIYLFFKSKWDEKTLLSTFNVKNVKEWGQLPDEDYTYERFQYIREYYLANQGELDVDDITWNDVDMDTIFMLMNRTYSSMGEDYLYSMLRKLEASPEELEKREELIQFFQANQKQRSELQTQFRFMGKVKEFSLYKYMNLVNSIPKHSPIPSIFMMSTLAISVILLVLSIYDIVPAVYGAVLLVVSIANNILQYFNRKAQIEKYFKVFMYILRMLANAKDLASVDIPKIKPQLDRILEITKGFKDLEKGAFIVFFDPKHGQGSYWDLILDYVRMITHIDLIKFDFMVKLVQSKSAEINELYTLLGSLDALMAVGSFRAMLGEDGWCVPELVKSREATLTMEEGYHPMLEQPVTNSIEANRPVLITGSNASGKSTFIKTVAINAILAQTVHTAVAKSYKASYFQVYSSMALRDDIQSNESYYIVEIKSLKRILEKVGTDIPMLCFVDEVLRGTNTLERIAASAQILESLSTTNTICFAATHDLELTHILQNVYDNYHFQEEVVDQEVVFDYTLREGRASSRNAIKLLGMMGYEATIIDKAEAMANNFLANGVWEEI